MFKNQVVVLACRRCTKIPKQQLVIKLMYGRKGNRNWNIFAHQTTSMENTKKGTGLYWFLFIVSLIGFFGLYQVIGGVSILSLPFVCTFFAKALDIM
jgi:hypothetical protein